MVTRYLTSNSLKRPTPCNGSGQDSWTNEPHHQGYTPEITCLSQTLHVWYGILLYLHRGGFKDQCKHFLFHTCNVKVFTLIFELSSVLDC